MESGTVARQNYSVQSRADGEKVVKANGKTLVRGRRRESRLWCGRKREESGKQWGKDKGRQRLTPEAERQNLITISQMKITRFQALHRAKPCWRLTLLLSIRVLSLSSSLFHIITFPLRFFSLSLSLTLFLSHTHTHTQCSTLLSSQLDLHFI